MLTKDNSAIPDWCDPVWGDKHLPAKYFRYVWFSKMDSLGLIWFGLPVWIGLA